MKISNFSGNFTLKNSGHDADWDTIKPKKQDFQVKTMRVETKVKLSAPCE